MNQEDKDLQGRWDHRASLALKDPQHYQERRDFRGKWELRALLAHQGHKVQMVNLGLMEGMDRKVRREMMV